MPENCRIAVDIGGTFTDTVIADGRTNVLATAKTLTTPYNPADSALEGARAVLAESGVAIGDVTGFIHGTTLATNALIERRGAVVACITTGGFRDILEIAYERRYSQYDINIEKPDLIVPRARCFTVPERISVHGEVLQELDESSIPNLIAQLDTCGATAVAICFLHAYANPAHEQRLRELLQAERPQLSISLSSDVSPEAREFDRLCTTIANAYVQPLMSGYLRDFEQTFAVEGLACPILMMTSGGGMTTLETAARFPIRLVESGPAGGAVLAAHVAREAGLERVLSFDMGGTTAKLCLIDGFEPQTSRHFEISRAERFIKGSGMPVRIPVVEMIEIGAGGGSIASVDRLGRIAIGPESAGSDPGPAGFANGGTDATVTDADLALGYIDPHGFAEGRLTVDVAAAEQAVEKAVGVPLGMSVQEAADAISQIVDENMASAGRMHAVESGKNIADRTMIAFGGNGPLHATRVARRAGVEKIVIPNAPGVGSAIGFLYAPVSFELTRSRYARLDNLDVTAINDLFNQMVTEAEAVVRAGAPGAALARTRTAFMRYHGQGHEIEIALPDGTLDAAGITDIRHRFEAEYRRQFARSVPGMEIEILNWGVRVATQAEPRSLDVEDASSSHAVPVSQRTVRCDVSGASVAAAVYDRHQLKPGHQLASPAFVVEPQTTTFVSADFTAVVDARGNLVLTWETARRATP